LRAFAPKTPMPKYRAFEALRDQLIDFLLAEQPIVGEKFFSVRELAKTSKLSHVTVYRAMKELAREGWVEQRSGQGTFVGPRAAMPVVPRRLQRTDGRSLVRLGMFSPPRQLGWFIQLVLEGIEQGAVEHGLSVEPIICREDDQTAARRRLAQTRPDVLAYIGTGNQPPFAVGDAETMGIPCMILGHPGISAKHASIYDDGAQGTMIALRHLLEQGHRKIGLVLATLPQWFVYDRHEGYLRGLVEAGLEPSERLVHWISTEASPEIKTERLKAYLHREKPTSLVFGYAEELVTLRSLVKSADISIPRDLSVVAFGHESHVAELLGMRATSVRRPFVEMGMHAAAMAGQLADGQVVPQDIVLPCSLVEGESVHPLRAAV